METKICGKCNVEVDIKNFPKWRTCCRRCCYKKHDEWKKKNKKILTHICIDCGTEHTKIIYAKTEKINDRCKKCCIKYKKPILFEKICSGCNKNKDVDQFYKNYRICKNCLFTKRNTRYKIRLNEDDIFRLKHNIKTHIRRQLKEIGCKKENIKTISIIGCSLIEFRKYIESKFEPWMNWNNRGLYNGQFNYGWDLDHIEPISSASSKEEILKLNHFTNFQPLCSKVNRDIKKNKL